MDPKENCLTCKQPVRPRQQGIQCDGCFHWNHRTCNTGISQQAYRAAVQIGNIEWRCAFCSTATSDADEPVAESTRLSVSVNSVSTIYDPPHVMWSDLEQLQEESAVEMDVDQWFSEQTLHDDASDQMDQLLTRPNITYDDEPMEDSISDPSIQDLTGSESYTITYQLVDAGTQRAKTKLVDSDGYSYNVKLRRANAIYWQCTVRPKGNQCKAIANSLFLS